MAHCVRCGRKLPLVTFGDLSDVCRECRAAEPKISAEIPPAGEPVPETLAPAPPLERPRITVTKILIAANVLVLAGMAISGGAAHAVQTLGTPSSEVLLRWGADWGPRTFDGEWWRVITSMFVHIGVLHLFMNMWCLRDYGRMAETVYGRSSFVALYLVAGVSGSLSSLAWHPNTISAGASAAIFGVVGSLIPPYRQGRLPVPEHALKQARKSLTTFVVYNLLFGFAIPAIDNAAHIGGLIAGYVVGTLWTRSASERGRQLTAKFVIAAVLVLATIGSAVWYGRRWDVAIIQSAIALEHGHPDTAVTKARLATQHKPDDALAFAILGEALRASGQDAAAVQAFEQSLRLKPDADYVLAELGSAYLKQQRWQLAYDALHRATQLNPKNGAALVDLGIALENLGRTDQAVDAIRAGVKASPELARGHYALGLLYEDADSRPQALASYEEASRLEPENVEYADHLARAYEANGRHDDAQAVRKRIASLKESAHANRGGR